MKNVKDTPNIPKRRATRKPAPKVDFLDSELRTATAAALRAKTAEVRAVTDVLRSLEAARKLFGHTPEWLAKIDRREIVQTLRGLIAESRDEIELLKMLTSLKGGRK